MTIKRFLINAALTLGGLGVVLGGLWGFLRLVRCVMAIAGVE